MAEDELLLGPHVENWLRESANRLRQIGQLNPAIGCELRLRQLRAFREFGLHDGHLELVIDDLFHAKTTDAHAQILADNPELTSERAREFISQRLSVARRMADNDAVSKYEFASLGAGGTTFQSDSQSPLAGIDTTEAVNTFVSGFILEPDPAAQRKLLEARPDLLQSTVSLLVASMFQPFIQQAQINNDLPTLRGLLLRQALFTRCQKVGIPQAFQELSQGATWNGLTQNLPPH